MSTNQDNFKKIISHAKEYGFIFQSSEIYDGLSAVYDYAQNGVELKNNIKKYWWASMVQMNDNIVGLDSSILMHPTTWKASGHVDAFNDPLIDNKDSKFGLLIAEGRILVKKGNKNGIWDAIEKFSKASSLFPRNGEPFYWIAQSYTKLGDTEFDLILESYEKSLALDLDEGLRLEVEKNYKIAKNRKSKLDSFWK